MRKPIPLIVIGEIDPILCDIGQHLLNKMRHLLSDTVDTCDRAEINRTAVIKMMMGVFMTELLRSSHAMGMEEKDFTGMCRAAFRGWKEDQDG